MNPETTILAEAELAFGRGDTDGALGGIMQAVGDFQTPTDGTWGCTSGFPRLDEFCQRLGESLLPRIAPGAASGREESPADVYLASEIYAIGGHTALIGDYARHQPHRPARLLLSNHLNRRNPAPPSALARTGLSSEWIEVCPVTGLADKVRWLMQRLAELRPHRVFVFNHPEDPIPVAAAHPSLARWVYFVHHADHSPALGVHLRCHAHLDLTPRAVSCCREFLGVERAVYVPLGCCAEARDPWTARTASTPLTTAASGSMNKFSFDGPLAYPEVITTLLARTTVRHIHFGPLPRELVEAWPRQLAARGIDPARLVHVPRVESLWRAMSDFGVDLYLTSFPSPGARTSVEVMGSGTPMLLHRGPSNPLAPPMQLAYPEAACWSTPDELVARVREADGPWLAGQQACARRYFERFHTAALIAPLFADDPIVGATPPGLDEAALAPQQSRISDFQERWLKGVLFVAAAEIGGLDLRIGLQLG